MHYTNNGIDLYQGDMVVGDREATTKEVEAYEAKRELSCKIDEAKAYLTSTDFKMTVDYYATLTETQQLELTAKRAEARAFLKGSGL